MSGRGDAHLWDAREVSQHIGVVDHAIVWSAVTRRLRPMAEQLDSLLGDRP